VSELLSDLVSRGLDFTEPRLHVLDGGKALSAAVKKHAGESAPIQRCQVHKRRNVLDHLTDEHKPAVVKRLNAAYALEDYAAAKQALNILHRELMDLNPSAASERGQPLFIPVLVLCELVWVLARSWRSIDSSIHNIAEISPSEAGCDLGTSTQKQD